MSFKPDIHFGETPHDVCKGSLDIILSVLKENQKEHKKTSLALSGGETPKLLFEMMTNHLDLLKKDELLTFIMGDDRLYPYDHEGSNAYWATEKLLKHFSKNFFLAMDVQPAIVTSESEKDGEAGARIVAKHYQDLLLASLPCMDIMNALNQKVTIPVVDIVLLGFGTDGHCASIFPDSIASKEMADVVTVSWPSPTMVPKVWRATLTKHVIQHAKHVIILVCREEKSWVVRGVLEDEPKGEVPVSRWLRECKGQVHFMLDKGAATGLQRP